MRNIAIRNFDILMRADAQNCSHEIVATHIWNSGFADESLAAFRRYVKKWHTVFTNVRSASKNEILEK